MQSAPFDFFGGAVAITPRRNNAGPERVSPDMDPVGLGMLLGLVNVIVIAAGMNAMEHEPGIAVAGNVFAFGFVPGTFTGALLGATAHKARALPAWLRRGVLALPALTLVVALAKLFQFEQYVVPAMIPTLAAVWCLEQRTREPVVLPRAAVGGRGS
jgi:hypothetical protein